MTFPKDHINIGRHGTKLPFIIPVVRKIFPLHISQFNKLGFFSIEGCHGRQLISIRFFFQCPESCIVKGKLCPVFFVEFILIAALTVVGIYVFVCKVLSSDIFFSAWMKIAVPVSADLEDDMIFFIEDLCKHEIAPGAATTTAQFILRFGLVAVMLVGGILVTADSLSIPMFILFLLFAGRIYDPFTSCFMLMAEVFSALVRVKRMKQIDATPEQTGTNVCNNKGYDIESKNVVFSYNEEPVLKGVSFVAKQGEVTALVGSSGSGKSTASKLAARFWDADSGAITLSGGERQRISIARALLKNAPIVLLDEATASMDAESETLIQDALSVLLKDKTVMVIAHRMRTVANADKIVALDDGKVSEMGTPAALMKKGGLYAHLVELQQGK